MKFFVTFFLSVSFFVQAEDLETLLGGKAETQQSLNSNFLVHAIMSDIKQLSSEQTTFLRKMSSAQKTTDWQDLLLQWNLAFATTEYEKSTNGKALFAYLKFKSGMPILGLEGLFQIQEPKKIHFQLINSWRELASDSHPAWLIAQIQWKEEWSEVFGPAIGIRVQSAELSKIQKKEELEKLSMMAAVDSKERALIDWNLALAYAKESKADQAAKIISALMKAKNNPVPMDLMNITAARLLYQNGYFDAAIRYYDKIPKSSEDYLEAQEEKSWSYLRKAEPQNALAVTQTLIQPVLSNQVGPESWFVRSLALLKVCDYPAVLEALQGFPKEYKNRTIELEKLSKSADVEAVQKVLEKMKTQNLSRADAVKDSKFLPRLLTRDERLRFLLKTQVQLKAEASSAEELYARSLQMTGLQGQFETLKNQINQRHSMVKAATLNRVQELAKNEVEETKKILNKLHIVEAEVIQQVEVASKLAKNLERAVDPKLGSTGSITKDSLKFPYEKEIWFDEITNYKVDIKKGCQAKAKPSNQEVR